MNRIIEREKYRLINKSATFLIKLVNFSISLIVFEGEFDMCQMPLLLDLQSNLLNYHRSGWLNFVHAKEG